MMRRLLFLLCLLAFPAQAADPIIYALGTGQRLSYSTTSSTIATGMGTQTRAVRVLCTSNCFIAFAVSGQSPHAAAATGLFLPAVVPEYFQIDPGMVISVTRDTTDGDFHVKEMVR